MWSCMISAVGTPQGCFAAVRFPGRLLTAGLTAGLALPLVVPPIRESFSKADVKSPPPVKQVETDLA